MTDTVEERHSAAPAVTLLAAGPLNDPARLIRSAEESRWRVGVDGGAARFLELGIVPDCVTGDFDSLSVETREALAAAGSRIVPTPDQDYTDLDKALYFCNTELSARDIRVFGATGGRLDHTFAAFSALVKYGRSSGVRLIDEIGEAWLVPGSSWLSGADLVGRVISLIPLGKVDGVSISGVRWPLGGSALAPGVRDGTSNLIVSDRVEIHAGSGNLIAFLHHAPTDVPLP